MKHDKTYSMVNLLHLMVKVIRFLVAQPSKAGESSMLQKQINLLQNEAEKTKYVYLSNLLELLYRNLQLFLVFEQTLISKKSKNDFRIDQLNRSESGGSKLPILPAPDNHRSEQPQPGHSYYSSYGGGYGNYSAS